MGGKCQRTEVGQGSRGHADLVGHCKICAFTVIEMGSHWSTGSRSLAQFNFYSSRIGLLLILG